MTAAAVTPAKPGVWAGLFCVNMALIAVLHISEAIEPPVPWILMALNMVLLVPMGRAAMRQQEAKGAISPALRRYNARALASMALYAVAMIGAGNLHDSVAEGSSLMWLLALVPVLPVIGLIWAMYRYYHEETDEFLRHRHVTAALVGLLLVLLLGTVWGFLEMFGLVPQVWNWWVVPVWAIGLGLGTCWPRREGEDA
ncbi:MAG: hypothetical protein JY451_05895 [Erythrobacter sp.]|nr:MAG: hypothetical protein JY451_05895 [Erythrobacter sp.]